MTEIYDNWRRVQERVVNAAKRAGREPEEIQIVAVCKTVTAERIRQAVNVGVKNLGENRVQEAWQKYQTLGEIADWHLVGHLQTNKVSRALQMFRVIHSVDSLRLAWEIQKRCSLMKKTVDILIQVNTSGETSKFGIAPDDTINLIEKISAMTALNAIGFMTIGKWEASETETRRCFQRLVKIKQKVENAEISGISLPHLSMGMSSDFEWAIEEGATMVRIGSAIFGVRPT